MRSDHEKRIQSYVDAAIEEKVKFKLLINQHIIIYLNNIICSIIIQLLYFYIY